MRLASGFKWSRRRFRVEVHLRGRLIAWLATPEAYDEQSRGAFRHLVADLLVQAGASVENAARFACQPIARFPVLKGAKEPCPTKS